METSPWLLDELTHAGAEHLDPTYVAGYDDKAQTDPEEDIAHLQQLGLDRASTLVDFGAGTGTFAVAAAGVCGHVVAVDVSTVMLDRLRERAGRLDISNLTCVQSGFIAYQHEGEPADFAYSRNALHHLPDFWKGIALQRVAAALHSGGIFFLRDLVFNFDPADAPAIINTWLSRAPVRPDAGYTASDLATHIREEYSTYSWLLEPLLLHAGFEIRDAEYSESKVFAAYTCIKR